MSAPSSPIPTPASAPAWTHFFLGASETKSKPGRRGRKAARPRSGDRSGTVLGEQWELLRRLGQGGMGEVYEAFYRGDRRRYAVKILSPGHADDPVTTERFRHEYLALRQMQAPGVVEAHALYRDGEDHFYSMELLGGRDLAALSREGPLPALEVIDVGLQLCATLAEVHAHGVIHRDVKPNNIVRLDDGSVKLVDLGVGKLLPAFYAETESRTPPEKRLLTAPGIKLGTPGYVAPEAGLGEPPCPRADVFSLGVTLFRLATRRMPFRAGRPVSIGDEPRSAEELGVELALALETVLRRAMITDPRHRLPSMTEFAEELDDARAELLAVTPVENAEAQRERPDPVADSNHSPSSGGGSPKPDASSRRWRRTAGPLLVGLVIGALGPLALSRIPDLSARNKALPVIDVAKGLRSQLASQQELSPRDSRDSPSDHGAVPIPRQAPAPDVGVPTPTRATALHQTTPNTAETAEPASAASKRKSEPPLDQADASKPHLPPTSEPGDSSGTNSPSTLSRPSTPSAAKAAATSDTQPLSRAAFRRSLAKPRAELDRCLVGSAPVVVVVSLTANGEVSSLDTGEASALVSMCLRDVLTAIDFPRASAESRHRLRLGETP